MKQLVIWVDDLRNPFDNKWNSFATNRKYVSGTSDVVWLKNYDEFVAWFELYSHSTDIPFPTLICFDHDLGEELTGFDCVKYLVSFCIDKKVGLPYCTCHSSNPVGRENILSYIESYRKSLQ